MKVITADPDDDAVVKAADFLALLQTEVKL
jgi:hypothetical protein